MISIGQKVKTNDVYNNYCQEPFSGIVRNLGITDVWVKVENALGEVQHIHVAYLIEA